MSLNTPLSEWQGKVAWLIGASSGIGEATAHALHAAGARVYVSARNEAALARFVQTHPGAVALPLDVTDPAAISAAAHKVQQAGSLNLVMYCAGHYKAQRADHFDLSQMLRHQEVNYLGALYMLDAVLPQLLKHRAGHICLVGSVAGYRGLPKSLAYGPTKAALINLAETLYMDLLLSGIGVSLVNPGFVETPLTEQNDFKMPALINSTQAAAEILAGWRKGEFEIHFPKRFTLGVKFLRWLPYTAFYALIRRFVKNPHAATATERQKP
jgi:NAD(P)-dependent dehydrogenase (short-subunit alcohol dehydrogenase family)